MNPGEVTTVIMKFDLPDVPFAVPAEPAHRRPRVRLALPHPRARGARHDAAADRPAVKRTRPAAGNGDRAQDVCDGIGAGKSPAAIPSVN